MSTKEITFDRLPGVEEITFDVEWWHSSRYDESHIKLPENYIQVIYGRYIEAAREAVKQIERRVKSMEGNNEAINWIEEERRTA